MIKNRKLYIITEKTDNSLYKGELEEKTSVGISDKSTGGRKSKIYNLDVIISVGYRVKSKNGVIFRQWATKILKDYMLKGYAVNQRRLEYSESIEVRYEDENIWLTQKMLAAVYDVSVSAINQHIKNI